MLVPQLFEENLDKIHKDLPTSCKENFHVLLLITAANISGRFILWTLTRLFTGQQN